LKDVTYILFIIYRFGIIYIWHCTCRE